MFLCSLCFQPRRSSAWLGSPLRVSERFKSTPTNLGFGGLSKRKSHRVSLFAGFPSLLLVAPIDFVLVQLDAKSNTREVTVSQANAFGARAEPWTKHRAHSATKRSHRVFTK